MLFRSQGYDFGLRDTLAINDTTMELLYYPRFRLQHTCRYATERYRFRDEFADSTLYANWYAYHLDRPLDTFELSEEWKVLENDLSLFQFPDPRNTTRFIQAGARHQMISSPGKKDFHNLILHGQIRMPSANMKWDMSISGEYYLQGQNGGDYMIAAGLARALSRKGAFLYLEGSQVNRNPSFIFDKIGRAHV